MNMDDYTRDRLNWMLHRKKERTYAFGIPVHAVPISTIDDFLERENESTEKTKIFISQPMNGKTNEEIKRERKKIEKWIDQNFENYEILDSFFEDAPHDAKPLYYLSKSLELLSKADIVVFAKGWQDARGCKLEHEAAIHYHIPVYEPDYGAVLDATEKKYLGDFIKPWRGRVRAIKKSDVWSSDNPFLYALQALMADHSIHNSRLQYIAIIIKDSDPNDGNIFLPCFNKKSKMYEGMELNKEYTLEELGL